MWRLIPWRLILAWLFKNARIRFWTTNKEPEEAIRVGGHDIPNVRDEFLVLEVGLGDGALFVTAYWQKC